MKKVISLLVALATALSVSAMAFAAEDIPGTQSPSTMADEFSGRGFEGESPMIMTAAAPFLSVGIDNFIDIPAYSLYLVEVKSKVVAGMGNRLIPNNEYKFRVYINNTATAIDDEADAIGASATELKASDLTTGSTLRLRIKKSGSNVSNVKIRTIGTGATMTYELVVTTKEQYTTTDNDVEYVLSATSVTANPIPESTFLFVAGWPKINDDMLDVGENGTITVTNDAPVISKDQFATLSRNANYKIVNFEGNDGGWRYSGRTSGMASTNLYYNYDVASEIINRLPDQDYKFLNFRGGVTFPTNGEMRIDVSDMNNNNNNNTNRVYAYLYRNGTLTRVNHTYDNGNDEIVFRTNYLGSFIITDREITDVNLLNNTNEPIDTTTTPTRPSGTENPQTGASAAMNLGVAFGLATLVTASAISRKRK